MAERREKFETSSGIELPNDYNPDNITPIDYEHDLGAPGEFPYTRAVRRNAYRGKFWTMRQYAGFATAEESNERYKYLLSQGTTGLSVAFDLPTQIGLDSDDPLAAGEVGKVGTEAVAPVDHRHVCLLRRRGPELEHHLDFGLSYPRSRLDGGTGIGVYAGRRHLLCAGSDRCRARCR